MIIVTPVVTIMKALTEEMLIKHPNMKRVYNPELSYDEGVKYLRAGTGFNDIVKNAGEVPVFMFNRSAIRRTDPIGRRWGVKPITRDIDAGTGQEYRSDWCEFDVRFLYITSDFRVLEQFEIGYIVGEGVIDIRQFEVDLSDFGIGSFTYLTFWKPLEEIQVGVEGSSYTGIAGTVTVRGHLVVLKGEVKMIKSIDLTTKDWLGFDLSLVSIVPA